MEGFCSLASGSKGNCLYIGTKKTKVLVDAGLSGLATQKRLREIGVSLEEIQGIFITHEHTDHIQGLKTLAFRYQIPVFANAETAKAIYSVFGACPQFKIFTTGESFRFEDLNIHPFSIPHDTSDPVAFTFHIDGLKIGVCADLGFATTLVRTHLKECIFLYLEANHEPEMVYACSRPMIYKQRVLGRTGHLSNEACGNLLVELLHPDLQSVQLAHLSQECNTPEKALSTVRQKLGSLGASISLSIAPQDMLGERVFFSLIGQTR